MYYYRPVRGSIHESMRELKIFKTKEEMFDYVVRCYQLGNISPFVSSDLFLSENVGEALQIGWRNTFYVLTKKFISKKYHVPQCVGYCSTDVHKGQ